MSPNDNDPSIWPWGLPDEHFRLDKDHVRLSDLPKEDLIDAAKRVDLTEVVRPNGGKLLAVKPRGPVPKILSGTTDGIYPSRTPAIVKGPTLNLTPEIEEQVRNMKAGQAARANGGKPRWGLLPLEVFLPVVEVLMFGAKKYAAWNFAEGDGLSWSEVGESLQRHLNAWLAGEDTDPESGKSHLGHIGCNLMFLLYYKMYAHKGYGKRDDRFKR